MSPPSVEPFLSPPNLLDQEQPQPSTAARWWVLHTWPRSEKALARQLLAEQIPYFLPVRSRAWRTKGQPHRSATPCFPGYLFVRSTQEILARFARANRMATLLPVPDQRQLAADLRGVHALMACGAPLRLEDQFEPGTPAEVSVGPLAGLVGKVLRRGRRLRFALVVWVLLRGLSVEIERGMFRVLPGVGADEPVLSRA
jgi:transcriptional antiterminator RfaH